MREGASLSAREGLDRSLVAVAYLIVLVMFFVTQRIFAGGHRVYLLVAVAQGTPEQDRSPICGRFRGVEFGAGSSAGYRIARV